MRLVLKQTTTYCFERRYTVILSTYNQCLKALRQENPYQCNRVPMQKGGGSFFRGDLFRWTSWGWRSNPCQTPGCPTTYVGWSQGSRTSSWEFYPHLCRSNKTNQTEQTYATKGPVMGMTIPILMFCHVRFFARPHNLTTLCILQMKELMLMVTTLSMINKNVAKPKIKVKSWSRGKLETQEGQSQAIFLNASLSTELR